MGLDRARIVQVAAGCHHGAAVTDSGQLFTWGRNNSGQCGVGAAGGAGDCVLTATLVAALEGRHVAFVVCGQAHTCAALVDDGSVYAFGANGKGQLGTGSNDDQLAPVRLACVELSGVFIVGGAAGSDYTILVSDGGVAFAMGGNTYGQLGLGHTNNVSVPATIDGAHFGGAPIVAATCG